MPSCIMNENELARFLGPAELRLNSATDTLVTYLLADWWTERIAAQAY